MNGLDAGKAALARGDWAAARLAFDTALQAEESPEALEGLGLAAWWLDQADVMFDVRERAYRLYRERDDHVSAARLAVWLAWDTSAFRGEHSIASGWLQRAARLLEGQSDTTEHAWLALRSGVFALLDDGDPDAAAAFASEAVRIGKALGEVGARYSHVVRTRMFVTRIADWELVGKAHAEVFGSFPPATSMVEVSRLIGPDFLVEIEADALVVD